MPTTVMRVVNEREEYARCAVSPAYFIDNHCRIEDKILRQWIRFRLWPAQFGVLRDLKAHSQVIILKARRLGLTWLTIGYGLWDMLFRPGGGVLFFSRRDEEAVDLLERLRQMHLRLPPFLQASVGTDNDHELHFTRLGSRALCFPTTKHSGRSYEGSLAIVDEADYIRWFRQMMNAVKPTVEAGGQLFSISTADKEAPSSEFKRLWHGAVKGENNYHPIFLPWSARPDRDEDWYEAMKADYEEDDLFQEYPATPEEALAPRSSDKRFSTKWLTACSDVQGGEEGEIGIPGLVVFDEPEEGETYLVVADPAEGNPGSNPSAASVFDSQWRQVAVVHGRFEPDVFGGYLVQLARWYNDAVICVERNNHGHAVQLAIRNLGAGGLLYRNPFDKKRGWLSSPKYKVQAVDVTAQALREGDVMLRDQATINELAIFEAASLKAPSGMTDDLAMTVIIGIAALRWPSRERKVSFGWA